MLKKLTLEELIDYASDGYLSGKHIVVSDVYGRTINAITDHNAHGLIAVWCLNQSSELDGGQCGYFVQGNYGKTWEASIYCE